MHRKTWKYLRFVWEDNVYQFRSSSIFGLSNAPYIFTMVTKELTRVARGRVIRLKMYLDDWLNLNSDQIQCTKDTSKLVVLTQAWVST